MSRDEITTRALVAELLRDADAIAERRALLLDLLALADNDDDRRALLAADRELAQQQRSARSVLCTATNASAMRSLARCAGGPAKWEPPAVLPTGGE